MKKAVFILIFYAIIILSNQPIFAQANRWQFISRNDNGSTSYLEKSNPKESGGRKQTWTKEVYSDGSYKITLVGWQCREKKFRIIESTNYAGSGEYIDREEKSPWATVIPDSVSEGYFDVVCALSRQTPIAQSNKLNAQRIAQVIVLNANIRELPNAGSRVVQKVEKGTRLFLANSESTNGWYQVFIHQTNETGWLYGNTMKLLADKSHSRQPQQKSKPTTNKSGRRAN